MKNTFGNQISVTLYGESHGPQIGVVIDGLPAGVRIDEDYLSQRLALRRPAGKISTARVECDPYRFESGVFEGRTTGTPICISIPNSNTHSSDYNKDLPRPSHADYTAECKYHGFQDYRGGGHFSGRVTVGLVAAGAIALSMLAEQGISVGTHIARIGEISDRPFGDPTEDIKALENAYFPVLDPDAATRMQKHIEAAAAEGDSVGGILETAIVGMPAGVGEPWFDTVEGLLAHAIFSVPAVKGVEFGEGFGFADLKGSEANDALRIENGRVVTATNHSGGINGGITSGMPITVRTVIKPTPSIFREQETVDLSKMENATLSLKGRHDPAIVHRARVVVDSVVALTLVDLLATRYGSEFFAPQND